MSTALDSTGGFDRRKKTYRDLAAITPTNVLDVIDNEVYEYVPEAQCKVCSLPHKLRHRIDRMLVNGKTYQKVLDNIIRDCEEDEEIEEDEYPSYWSIRNHQKRHLDYDKRAIRDLLERRAQERGLSILEGHHNIITSAAIYELVMQRGYDHLVDPESMYIPSINELLQAASLLEKLDAEGDAEENIRVLTAQFNTLIEAVRSEVPEDIWNRIVERLQAIRSESDQT